ncbi:MAG: hypothetical protein ACK5Z5_00940 [Neisseriaceae bacterium]
MKNILFLCLMIIVSIAKAVPINNSSTVLNKNGKEVYQVPFSESALSSTCHYPASDVIFMPIITSKADKDGLFLISKKFESRFSKDMINELIKSPLKFYGDNKTVSNLKFVNPSKKFINWQNNNSKLLKSLNNLTIAESIEIPQSYTKKNSNLDYVLFGVLRRLEIIENKDNIPYSNLVSLIVSVNIRVLFVLVSVPNGKIIKKFVAIGHSGVSKLLETNFYQNYNIDYNDLLNDGFISFVDDIQDNLNDSTLTGCMIESSSLNDKVSK